MSDTARHAYAVPGCGRHTGRVVVSTGMLVALSAPQRRALFAHEYAHLRHHHHRYIQLARLAAAANPLVRPVATAVDQAVERWADAVAVREVGDRGVVAHPVGSAALARPTLPAQGLGAGHNDVVERVRDLLKPPRRSPMVGAHLALTGVLCWASTAAVVLYIYGVIELSEGLRS